VVSADPVPGSHCAYFVQNIAGKKLVLEGSGIKVFRINQNRDLQEVNATIEGLVNFESDSFGEQTIQVIEFEREQPPSTGAFVIVDADQDSV